MGSIWVKSALLLSVFLGTTFSSALRGEENGEAKESRLNAMKKVEDGNPVLRTNMMNHLMQAQLYRAQMNFPKAAEEDMKAQLLKQQIDQNDTSKDKNQKQKDDVIYTSDAAQKQMRMEVGPAMQSPGGRAEATNASAAWAPKPAEALNFDEQVTKQKSETELETESAALILPDAPEAAVTPASPVTGATPAPIVTEGNKVLSAGLMQAFDQIEQSFQAQQPNEPPLPAEAVAAASVAPEFPSGVATLSKVQLSDEMKALNAKKEKERDSFWKTKKNVKKKGSARGSKRRGIAKVSAKKKTKEFKKAALTPEMNN